MTKRLENKVVLITGGTSGIGAETARLIINEGSKVVISGRSEEKGELLSKELGDNSKYLLSDVTKEKDIALDVSKRLAKKIERNSKTKVILTREEDIFVRLKDRTKFANVNKGDLFISIHTNAAEDRRASGFETFLIGINKNEEAIRVAARENAVLELEDGGATKLTDEALIQATMSQAAFANLSEQFAALVQEEMSKRIQSKNRGVKQAGFYVLMGASLPIVLVEL